MGIPFIGHDTCSSRIRPLLCRLGLSRTEEKSGDPGAKSLLNPVEMKSDSFRGHSEGIRTTRRLPEHFSERKAFYECCLCPFIGQSTSYALYSGDCSFITQRWKSQSGSTHALYHQDGFSV